MFFEHVWKSILFVGQNGAVGFVIVQWRCPPISCARGGDRPVRFPDTGGNHAGNLVLDAEDLPLAGTWANVWLQGSGLASWDFQT